MRCYGLELQEIKKVGLRLQFETVAIFLFHRLKDDEKSKPHSKLTLFPRNVKAILGDRSKELPLQLGSGPLEEKTWRRRI